jgi:hypothetical protein
VRQSPLGTPATSGPIVPAFGGRKIGRGKRSSRRKPAPVPLCPVQIPHTRIPTRDLTRAAAVWSRALAALAMAWPRWLIPLGVTEFLDSVHCPIL